jgi:hypothetical protein
MHAFASRQSFGAAFLRWFFDWYAPKFSARSFALARNNEYEADKVSVELTSARVATSALVSVHATAPHIEENFWARLIRQADTTPEPPKQPYRELADFLEGSPIGREELERRIDKELEIETHYANTHPSLKDRIAAIGSHAVVPDPVRVNAAEAWLGGHYETILDHFDRMWTDRNEVQWKNRYGYVAHARESLGKYQGQELDSLNDEELWDFASWTREFVSLDDAFALYCAFQRRHPNSIGAAFHIGMVLAERDDPAALDHLRIAFGHPDTLGNAARCGYELLQRQGETDGAESWWAEAMVANQYHQEAAAERAQVTTKDDLESPVINDGLFELLKHQLHTHKNVKSAWLAQKVLQFNPESPVYVVAIRPKGIYMSSDSVIEKVAGNIDIEADVFVVGFWGGTGKIGRKVKKSGEKIL